VKEREPLIVNKDVHLSSKSVFIETMNCRMTSMAQALPIKKDIPEGRVDKGI
jgi:hypothetical protein